MKADGRDKDAKTKYSQTLCCGNTYGRQMRASQQPTGQEGHRQCQDESEYIKAKSMTKSILQRLTVIAFQIDF
jgi:hypothetical protein